jgi:transposase-like protein
MKIATEPIRDRKQRYRCQNADGPHQSFLLNPAYQGHLPEIKEQIVDMARGGNGIRDTADRANHLTLRTRIKRLTRKTICFSKSIQMHDIVLGFAHFQSGS